MRFLRILPAFILIASASTSSHSRFDLGQNDYGNFGFPFTKTFYSREPLLGGLGQAVIGGHQSHFGGAGLGGLAGLGLGHGNGFGGGHHDGFYPGTPGYPNQLGFDHVGLGGGGGPFVGHQIGGPFVGQQIEGPFVGQQIGGPFVGGGHPSLGGGGFHDDFRGGSGIPFAPAPQPIINSNPSFDNFAGGLLGGSSANALGGGTVVSGHVNSNNVAFTQPGFGFSNSQSQGQGNGANIFSVASSSNHGR